MVEGWEVVTAAGVRVVVGMVETSVVETVAGGRGGKGMEGWVVETVAAATVVGIVEGWEEEMAVGAIEEEMAVGAIEVEMAVVRMDGEMVEGWEVETAAGVEAQGWRFVRTQHRRRYPALLPPCK
ncbi:hypothetical protein ACKKBG_A34785 [Auxenochlorella protothecoides x Auxenochlorella symbiontica]